MRLFALFLTLALCLPAFADETVGKSAALLSAATSTSTGSAHKIGRSVRSYQCYGTTSASTGAATIKIEVSNDNTVWAEMASVALTLGTTVTSDGFAGNVAWLYQRARVSAISGTGASVTCNMGY